MLNLEVEGIGSVRETGNGRSLLQVQPAYTDGLHGVNADDRVQVLYWMHEFTHTDRRSLQVHPGGDAGRPLRGVFALRSCTRPNPIGVSEVDVVEVRDTGVAVDGIIVGGIAMGALMKLQAAGIAVFRAVHPTVAETIAAFRDGSLHPVGQDQACVAHHGVTSTERPHSRCGIRGLGVRGRHRADGKEAAC
jgi:hypothetical protein